MAGKWLPTSEGALVTWYVNYKAKLNVHAGTFPTILTLPALASVANDLLALQHMVGVSVIEKTHLQDVNDYKRQLIYGPGPIGVFPTSPTYPAAPTPVAADIVERISRLAEDLKADSAYTTAIGEDIGIESPAAAAAATVLTCKATALPGSQVRVDFNKDGTDGAWIESSVDDGPWLHIASDHFPPYLDTRPPAVAGKAEVRRYRVRPLDGDDPVGDWSATAQVSTVP